MREEELFDLIRRIEPADSGFINAALERQAKLVKIPGSLGKLEDYSVKLAGIQRTVHPEIRHPGVLVLASDNGVVEEGVSATPKSVTLSQCINMTRHLTGMSALAHHFGDDILVVDVGIDADIDDEIYARGILNRKIRKGTSNLYREAAMSREEAVTAILTGAEAAGMLIDRGADAVGIGEMGIGNTTTSACVLAALTGSTAEEVTGRGGGLTEVAFAHKKEVIAAALRLHFPDFCDETGAGSAVGNGDVIDVLSKVGGFDLAAMCGAYIGCAVRRTAAVVDGYISSVAALCAVRLCPTVKDYLFLSHASSEVGYRIATGAIGLEPCLMCGMRLGEGSGCVIMFRILEAACAALNEMGTFEEADIDDAYLDDLRRGEPFSANPLVTEFGI